MSHSSGSSHLLALFAAAVADYKKQTGIELLKHPLSERLLHSNTVEFVTDIIFHEQAQDFKGDRERDKVLKPLEEALHVLYRLSAVILSLVCP